MTSLTLDLSSHCILTEMKRRHSRLVSACLTGKEDPDLLEPQIELLVQALTQLDLPAMRGATPTLAGGDGIQVILSESQGLLRLTHDGTPLPLISKS